MGIIVVGSVIKKDNKYLLVQEAQECCRGKWNIPTGLLDANETVFEGAKREVFEECGYNVALTGIANIGNRVINDNEFLGVIFSAEIIGGNIKLDEEEILDAKWLSYDEIMNMKDEIRSQDWILHAITAVEKNNIYNLELIQIIK